MKISGQFKANLELLPGEFLDQNQELDQENEPLMLFRQHNEKV